MASMDTARQPIPAWYSVARQRNTRRRQGRSDAEQIRAWWDESQARRGWAVAEAATVEIAVRPDPQTVPAALTGKGAATVALLRFERLFRALGPADRRWFAGELAGLAREAGAS